MHLQDMQTCRTQSCAIEQHHEHFVDRHIVSFQCLMYGHTVYLSKQSCCTPGHNIGKTAPPYTKRMCMQ